MTEAAAPAPPVFAFASRSRLVLALGVLGLLIVLALGIRAGWQPGQAPQGAGRESRLQPVSASRRAPPEVEPLVIQAIPADAARAINAAVPIVRLPNPPARPFRSALAGADLRRAVDCLAAAAIYEAGGSDPGQRAVMQVVLNRARHPAFPPTVCGVVFQGAERSTGCQFTFTCDGAMARYRPSERAWQQAQALAKAALDKAVFAPVGTATHYHTDWVVPYWSATLTKIAVVETHLFFRWPGFWGTRPAFTRRGGTAEPAVAALAPFSAAHMPPATQPAAQGVATLDPAAAPSALAAPSPAVVDEIALPAATPSGRYAIDALAHCADQADCRLVGWVGGKPAAGPIDPVFLERHPPDFIFIQKLRDRVQRARWNCARLPRPHPSQCLPPASGGLVFPDGVAR